MNRKETVEREYIECDGCQYVIGLTAQEKADGVLVASKMSTLSIPFGGQVEEFHFHGPDGHRRDCFRYWAHSPRVMQRTLEDREFDPEQVDDFMATHLYRTHSAGPGIERPRVTA